MLQIWPAILVAGVSFAIPQFLISNFHGPWLVDVVAAMISMGSLALFLKLWKPSKVWTLDAQEKTKLQAQNTKLVLRAWLPWIILSVVVFFVGRSANQNCLARGSCAKLSGAFA